MEGVGISVQSIQDTNQRLDALIEVLRRSRKCCVQGNGCAPVLPAMPTAAWPTKSSAIACVSNSCVTCCPPCTRNFSPSAHASKPKKPTSKPPPCGPARRKGNLANHLPSANSVDHKDA